MITLDYSVETAPARQRPDPVVPRPAAPRSPYHLTEEQVEFFRTPGEDGGARAESHRRPRRAVPHEIDAGDHPLVVHPFR